MKRKRSPSVRDGLIVVTVTAVFLIVGSVRLHTGLHVPLSIGLVVAGVVASTMGYSWSEIQEMMVGGVGNITVVLFILMLAGAITGVWILPGTVPAMVYYGLKLASPRHFLAISFVISCVVSLAMGSSLGSASTVGVALMGVGQAMGIPLPIVAGAIVSGVFFGDRLSPLGSALNVTSAVTGTEVYETARHLIPTTIPAVLVCLAAYEWLGRRIAAGSTVVEATLYTESLGQLFYLTPWLLVPPLMVLVLAAARVAAIPNLAAGALLGAVMAMLFQKATLAEVFNAMHKGFVSDTGIVAVDRLLTRGGVLGMADTLTLLMIALALSGVMERTGILGALVRPFLKRVRSVRGLIWSTAWLSMLIASMASSQNLALIISGRLFGEMYEEAGLHPKNLARTALDTAGVIVPLIPWSLNGLFMAQVLGVETVRYAPYAFLCLLIPATSVAFGMAGFDLPKVNPPGMNSSRPTGSTCDPQNDAVNAHRGLRDPR